MLAGIHQARSPNSSMIAAAAVMTSSGRIHGREIITRTHGRELIPIPRQIEIGGVVSPAGRRPGPQNTRGEIVDAARREFVANGYADTTIRSVARAAEVDPALVYHYFGDKAP